MKSCIKVWVKIPLFAVVFFSLLFLFSWSNGYGEDESSGRKTESVLVYSERLDLQAEKSHRRKKSDKVDHSGNSEQEENSEKEGIEQEGSGKEKIPADYAEKYKELFKLYADIELMNDLKEKYEQEIDILKERIATSADRLDELSEEICILEADYGKIMRSRQMYGELSGLKLVLSSANVSQLVYRASLLGEISSTYRRATDGLDIALAEEQGLKEGLESDQIEIIEKKEDLEKSIVQKEASAKELEEYLEAQGADRSQYEEELENLSTKWEELKPLFDASVESIKQLVDSGGLPNDVAEMKVTMEGVKAVVREEVFNRMLQDAFDEMEGATTLIFDMEEEGIYVRIPSHEVLLFGVFDVRDQSMIYRVERGTFYGIEMGDSAIEDLFLDRELVFDLSSLIGKNELTHCRLFDEYIEISVDLHF